MKFRSTRDPDVRVALEEAVLRSLPADRGLYVPEAVPELDRSLWDHVRQQSFADVARCMAEPFFSEGLPQGELDRIVDEALIFDAPLVPVADGIWVLELWHGPTLAFKDFGARFMARTMARLRRHDDRELTVLVATSGDTGAAVASGFFGVDGVRVFILFPEGRVSPVQEQQLTTFGGNVTPLRVRGTFDDCQALVKKAFLDPELNAQRDLTSANSINVARLLPQTFYYARAWQQWPNDSPPTFCVPSGNLGNLCAGLIAHCMGMPATGFVAATNVNDAFVRHLQGLAVPDGRAHRTLSNAIDVAVPSNLERIEWLYQARPALTVPTGHTVDDETTLKTMARVYADHGYLLDPHTAVGWTCAERHRVRHPGQQVVVLATAHPAKFPDAARTAIGRVPPPPDTLRQALERPQHAHAIEPNFEALKSAMA